MKRLQRREVLLSQEGRKGRKETGGGGLGVEARLPNVCPVVSEVVDLVPQD